jgi:hypothetical protein
MGTGSFPEAKGPGRRADHPPLSRAEVKEREELYLYSLPTPSLPALGWYLLSPVKSTIASLVRDCTHRRAVAITNMLKPEYICVLLTQQRLRSNCCLIMLVTNFGLLLSINQNPIVMGVCCGWRRQQYWAARLYMGYLSY